jgi:hypothetical protein
MQSIELITARKIATATPKKRVNGVQVSQALLHFCGCIDHLLLGGECNAPQIH